MSFLSNNQSPHSVTALQCFVGSSVRLDCPVLTQVFKQTFLEALSQEMLSMESLAIWRHHLSLLHTVGSQAGHEVCSDLEGWQPDF